jgi:hypothetical protein
MRGLGWSLIRRLVRGIGSLRLVLAERDNAKKKGHRKEDSAGASVLSAVKSGWCEIHVSAFGGNQNDSMGCGLQERVATGHG